MTLLEINLTDVLSETDPDDRVIVWAPVMREGPAGQLVGPRRKSIPLTDGVGSDEVVPGPLMVQVQCKAMSDTRPREVVVPDEGPVTLTGLLDSAGAFTYAPAIIGQVAQMRDAAEAAQQAAEDARDAAVKAVDTPGRQGETPHIQDGTWWIGDEDTGVIAEGQDGELSPEDLLIIEQAAVDAAADATNTSVEASALAVLAATQFDQLIGEGMPEGVLAAPVGTVYTDRVATAGAVKWVKVAGAGTSGWRVLWGDTGLRKLVTFHTDGTLTNHGGVSDPDGFTSYNDTVEGGLWVRRVNQKVIYYLRGKTTASQIIRLPAGFRPDGNPYPVTTIPYSSTASQNAAVGGTAIYISVPTDVSIPGLGGVYAATITFDTYLPWPTTRPGIPDD